MDDGSLSPSDDQGSTSDGHPHTISIGEDDESYRHSADMTTDITSDSTLTDTDSAFEVEKGDENCRFQLHNGVLSSASQEMLFDLLECGHVDLKDDSLPHVIVNTYWMFIDSRGFVGLILQRMKLSQQDKSLPTVETPKTGRSFRTRTSERDGKEDAPGSIPASPVSARAYDVPTTLMSLASSTGSHSTPTIGKGRRNVSRVTGSPAARHVGSLIFTGRARLGSVLGSSMSSTSVSASAPGASSESRQAAESRHATDGFISSHRPPSISACLSAEGLSLGMALEQRRKRLCDLMVLWVRTNAAELVENEDLAEYLENQLSDLRYDLSLQPFVIQIAQKLEEAMEERPPPPIPEFVFQQTPSSKLALLQQCRPEMLSHVWMDKQLISQIISTIFLHLFRKIDRDCFTSGRVLYANSHYKEFCKFWNCLSHWSATCVLLQLTVQQQTNAIAKLIQMAEEMLTAGNFAGASAVHSGLLMSPISRIRPAWQKLAPELRVTFDSLGRVFTPIGNYSQYRELVAKSSDNVIPHMAIMKRDLVYYDEINLYVNGRLNVAKLRRLADVLSIVKRTKYSSYMTATQAEAHVTSFLFFSNLVRSPALYLLTEEQMVEMSFKLAPRDFDLQATQLQAWLTKSEGLRVKLGHSMKKLARAESKMKRGLALGGGASAVNSQQAWVVEHRRRLGEMQAILADMAKHEEVLAGGSAPR